MKNLPMMPRRTWLSRLLDWNIFSFGVLAMFGAITGIVYSPAFVSQFMGDDFNFLGYLYFNFKTLLDGRGWNIWFTVDPVPGTWVHFRIGRQLFYLLDYTMWHLNPLGYHLTDLVLHISNAFLVFLLCWLLTHKRVTAVSAGLLFAILPVNLEVVAWFAARADGFSTLYFLIGLVFFILFRQRGLVKFLIISLGAFAFGLTVKESVLTLPIMLGVYDGLYHLTQIRQSWKYLLPHLPFWILVMAYLGLRVVLLGQSGASELSQARFLDSDWIALLKSYLTFLMTPFVSDLTTIGFVVSLVVIVCGFIGLRNRRDILLGGAWLAITITPALVNTDHAIYERFIYLPVIGLAIILAEVLTRPIERPTRFIRAVGLVGLMALGIIYSVTLYGSSVAWTRTTQVTKLVTDQVRALHPTLPSDAMLVFKGLPIVSAPSGVPAFGYMVTPAMRIAFGDPGLQATSVAKFPMWFGVLDRTLFFEYSRRQIVERTDLIAALEQRNRCSNFSVPAIEWNFSAGVDGWEPWNELDDFSVQDGLLTMQSKGNDPYMASPLIDISAIEIGDLEITMRVRASQPELQSTVYWLATDQTDFSPGLKQALPILADGKFHTYLVDISKTGQLSIGDHILRLRLDPVNAPAEIAIQSIRVFTHCSSVQGVNCTCGQ